MKFLGKLYILYGLIVGVLILKQVSVKIIQPKSQRLSLSA